MANKSHLRDSTMDHSDNIEGLDERRNGDRVPEVAAIVDRHLESAEFIELYLQKYHVSKHLGVKSFEFAYPNPKTLPDVLLLDYFIEDEGEAALALLKKYKGKIPLIIIVTGAYHDGTTRMRCYQAGASDVIDKLNLSDLDTRIMGLWHCTQRVKRMCAKGVKHADMLDYK